MSFIAIPEFIFPFAIFLVVERLIRFFFSLFTKPLFSFYLGPSSAFLWCRFYFLLFGWSLVTCFKMSGIYSDCVVCDESFFQSLFDNLSLNLFQDVRRF